MQVRSPGQHAVQWPGAHCPLNVGPDNALPPLEATPVAKSAQSDLSETLDTLQKQHKYNSPLGEVEP